MLEDIIRERKKKLDLLKKESEPYPARIRRTHTISEVLESFNGLSRSQKAIFIVGRLLVLRDQGKIIFGDIADETGKIQIVLNRELTKNFELIKKTAEAGDFLEVQGKAFKTSRGEKSLLVKNARIIAKTIRPIPLKWYGLEDIETRLRERYLDILLHPNVKEMFTLKSRFWDGIRENLKEAGFLEVDLPALESIPGGADAEPFKTHHNALAADFYLRISLELPLKKLLVGGYEKVFEIGRIFRNEGIDRDHLQDYVQMECYAAYWDYNDMMKFTEGVYKKVIKKTLGSLKTKFGEQSIDWGKRWPKVDYYDIFKKNSGVDLKTATRDVLYRKAEDLKLSPEARAGKGRLIDLIFKKTVRPKLVQPCFLVDPPVEIEPLAKRLENDLGRVARFQIMAAGTELGKGFSELNDPLDQRKRFEEQMKLREAGDKEAQALDEEFLTALEYGMPPAAGFGISERLFSVLVDKPVRETVFFPLMKSKKEKNVER